MPLQFETRSIPISRFPDMKRRRPIATSIPSSKNSPPLFPSTPPTTIRSSKPRRNLIREFSIPPPPPPSSSDGWEPLQIGRSELFLPLTFPTGQTFRWKQTGPFQYTGPIRSHLFSLKQMMDGPDGSGGDVAFFIHHTPDRDQAVEALREYLNLGVSLSELWSGFSESDSRFALLGPYLSGARVLRQEPLDCLFQFLCSSNNNIGRITKMVDVISTFGDYLGSVEGFTFHQFPSLDRLALVSEDQLRKAGFGYSFLGDSQRMSERTFRGGDVVLSQG